MMKRGVVASALAVFCLLAPIENAVAAALQLDVAQADMVVDGQTGLPALNIELSAGSAKAFGELTTQHLFSMIELVLDGKVLTAPIIRSPIFGGSLQITGNFSEAEIMAMVERLEAGTQIEVRVVKE